MLTLGFSVLEQHLCVCVWHLCIDTVCPAAALIALLFSHPPPVWSLSLSCFRTRTSALYYVLDPHPLLCVHVVWISKAGWDDGGVHVCEVYSFSFLFLSFIRGEEENVRERSWILDGPEQIYCRKVCVCVMMMHLQICVPGTVPLYQLVMLVPTLLCSVLFVFFSSCHRLFGDCSCRDIVLLQLLSSRCLVMRLLCSPRKMMIITIISIHSRISLSSPLSLSQYWFF